MRASRKKTGVRAGARGNQLIVPSFAKVNLGLDVGPVRSDGYHEIATLFQTVDLHDTLTFRRARHPGMHIACEDSRVPKDETNLMARAYRALAKEAGDLPGIDVAIEKRIPVGGGMGGGSSNAGTTLRALNRWLDLGFLPSRLAEIGATLGSDVPFFVLGGLALGLGRGELLVPLPDMKRRYLVLIMPSTPVSTAEVYASVRRLRSAGTLTAGKTGHRIFRFLMDGTDWATSLTQLSNDLVAAAKPLVSGYDKVVGRLRASGAELASLSGSGSTVFGMFQARSQAVIALSAVRELVLHRSQVARTVGRGEYRRAIGGRISGVS